MTGTRRRVIQVNCQRAYGVMCDLSRVMCVNEVTIALLLELYISYGLVNGLPSEWRVHACESRAARAAVVVSEERVESLNVCDCTN